MISCRKKLVTVGDGMCGKSSLLISYSTNCFPENCRPATIATYLADVEFDGGKVKLSATIYATPNLSCVVEKSMVTCSGDASAKQITMLFQMQLKQIGSYFIYLHTLISVLHARIVDLTFRITNCCYDGISYTRISKIENVFVTHTFCKFFLRKMLGTRYGPVGTQFI